MRKRWILSKMARPSRYLDDRVERSSVRTKSELSLATSVPVPITDTDRCLLERRSVVDTVTRHGKVATTTLTAAIMRTLVAGEHRATTSGRSSRASIQRQSSHQIEQLSSLLKRLQCRHDGDLLGDSDGLWQGGLSVSMWTTIPARLQASTAARVSARGGS